jgi:hypothetical protein
MTARIQFVTILDAFLYDDMTPPLGGTRITDVCKRSNMSNETESDPKQQVKQDPTGSVNTDKKTNPSTENQGNRPQDISKKNPSQGSDPQHQGQEKPKDEKRRAS